MSAMPIPKPRAILPPNKVETPKNVYTRKEKHKKINIDINCKL